MFSKQWKNRIMKQKAMVLQHFPYLEHAMSGQRNCITLRQVVEWFGVLNELLPFVSCGFLMPPNSFMIHIFHAPDNIRFTV